MVLRRVDSDTPTHTESSRGNDSNVYSGTSTGMSDPHYEQPQSQNRPAVDGISGAALDLRQLRETIDLPATTAMGTTNVDSFMYGAPVVGVGVGGGGGGAGPVLDGSALGQGERGRMKGALPEQLTGESSNASPPPQMSATLTGADRHLSEFSSTYIPAHSYPASSNNTTPGAASGLSRSQSSSTNPFLSSNRPGLTGHKHSSSSSAFDPAMDLSSFDASSSRALPGRRGAPGVGMDGWSENEADVAIARTWEEEQQRRRMAEFELAKRKEQAEKEEMERRLGEEFWKGEEEKYGPVVTQPRIQQQQQQQQQPFDSSIPVSLTYSGVPGSPGYYPPVPAVPPLVAAEPQERYFPTHPPSISSPAPQPPPQPPAQAENLSPPQQPPRPPSAPKDPSAETYQIKHINWKDPITNLPRRSPILLQNANGPCPLLALVNALTLSTPSNVKTSLGETLRIREQVSLGLLLDAVFDGVVSKATSGDVDVGDLFAFLLNLRTGMNVNPRFVPPLATNPPVASSPSSVPPPPPPILGAFEETKEMKLYNSFEIPLYHGWIPHPDMPAYKVLQKVAPTYEEAQNIILHEEEILCRISTAHMGDNAGELSEQDQVVIKNAAIVREWLESSRTQLTSYGIECLTRFWGGDGKVGILFRNDHFLTVVRNKLPGSGQGGDTGRPVLFALVTDMGYSGYEEVVWESLVSVGGEGGQFFAGDFRTVGGDGNAGPSSQGRQQNVRSMLDFDNDDEGWETVGAGRQNKKSTQSQNRNSQSQSKSQQTSSSSFSSNPPPQPQRRSFVDVITGRGHQPPQQTQSIDTRLSSTSHNNSSTSIAPARTSSTRAPTSAFNDNNAAQSPTSVTLVNFVPPPLGEDSTDYDLALALQLQEEEDDRERQRIARQNQLQGNQGRNPAVNFPAPPPPPPPPPPSGLFGPSGPPLPPPNATPQGAAREVPPPPYERHASSTPGPGPRPGSGNTPPRAPEIAAFSQNQHQNWANQSTGNMGGLSRRRSEVVRLGTEARNLISEFTTEGGSGNQRRMYGNRAPSSSYPGNIGGRGGGGGQRGRTGSWDHGAHGGGGHHGGGGGSKKECTIM